MSRGQVLGYGQLDTAAICHGEIVLYDAFTKCLLTHNLSPAKHSVMQTTSGQHQLSMLHVLQRTLPHDQLHLLFNPTTQGSCAGSSHSRASSLMQLPVCDQQWASWPF